jgi:hypothetical protein
MSLGDQEAAVSYTSDVYYHIGLAYCMIEKFEKSIYPFTKVSFCFETK